MNIFSLVYRKSLKDVNEHFKIKRENNRKEVSRNALLKEYLSKYGSEPKLQIGCGAMLLDGWFNTDIVYNDKVAYLDAASRYPFNDNTFGFIFAEHLFEHLSLDQEMAMLRESLRVLKPGGVLRLSLPSADFLMNILERKAETTAYVKWAVNSIPRLKIVRENIKDENDFPVYVVNNFYRDWGHQTLHNEKSLSNLLERHGFAEIMTCGVGQSVHSALRNIEQHMNTIPDEFNKLETMIIEAKKMS